MASLNSGGFAPLSNSTGNLGLAALDIFFILLGHRACLLYVLPLYFLTRPARLELAKAFGIDEGLPSLKGKSVLLCPFGCRYVFSSDTDALRHCCLMDHRNERVAVKTSKIQVVLAPL